ncbi:M48 family metallopeptidase [Undibacterium jejuense]|uniref:M48 family metallopeptidase n=1 Tax=Undibacterium jejuense TaxID=1344949 RepID=A0A923HHX7_9BURK|nr:M48 family metallopeptidase [Undibacterium jejuense]MBC3862743.1 M48 family metallopeptidase [Undibacterium jejuense]
MDFFEQQDQAHRQSRKLLILFALAVIAILVAVNVSLALIWKWGFAMRTPGHPGYPTGFFFINTAVTLLFIVGGTMFETFRLRDGGDAVAQMAGGRLVMPDSTDAKERRLLNIVEEMALASGIACPRVYVLDREDAINAFAAGYHQNEAVVAVTQGSLTRLTRDELQGVIGHEFSHILNGDMRMNIKLIGVLFGIQMIAGFGQEMMYWASRFGSSRDRDEKGPPIQLVIVVFGAALFVIGYVGIFFGRLIKSAVSRQREFLADASAVQFTRDPETIGGALRKIGGLTMVNQCGSRINNPRAEQISHMFLGAAKVNLMDGMFATHPPLKERLQRVYGHNVEFLDASEIVDPVDLAAMPEGVYGFGARNVEAAQRARAVERSSDLNAEFGQHAIPTANTIPFSMPLTPAATAVPQSTSAHGIDPFILTAARDSTTADALVFALLSDRSEPQAYAIQQSLVARLGAEKAALTENLLNHLESLQASPRLPILDLAMPALKQLSSENKAQLLSVASKLIAADQKMSQSEFVLQTVLERRLGPQAGRMVKVKFNAVTALKSEVQLLLSLVARSHSDDAQAGIAFQRAAATLPELAFQSRDLLPPATLDFFVVRQALEKLNQLAPLAKPFLIKAVLAAATRPQQERMDAEMLDLVRGICAAVDAPVPDVVGMGANF